MQLYPPDVCFITLVGSPDEERHIRLFVKSLRAFGGEMAQAPLWVFHPASFHPEKLRGIVEGIHIFPLDIPQSYPKYLFSDKICACAQAEAMSGRLINSLVWVNPECLVISPPLLFKVGVDVDAAFRPVHIRNIGSPSSQPSDGFWRAVYATIGLEDAPFTIESFIDAQTLRPYFNTHCFSFTPSPKLMRDWQRTFKDLALDPAFQSAFCADQLHQIFLHQAVLSALIAKQIPQARLRILPPEYSYPLHLHPRVPPHRQPLGLNALVCPVYEDAFEYPKTMNKLFVEEPLASWFSHLEI